jgi:DNA-binding NtrC family response regulator
MTVDHTINHPNKTDLRCAVNQRTFRSDLWYRLNTVRVTVPPLRERRDDIAMLVTELYRELCGDPAMVLPTGLVRTLTRGAWHGNVRELRSAIERSLIGAPPMEYELARGSSSELTFKAAKNLATADWERRYLSELLPAHDGNVSRAARAAKMNRSHLSELVNRHGLAARDDD